MPVLRNARATSCGGVIHRSVHGTPEVALVHRRQPTLWALPKGTPSAGETPEETALRETREETGLEVRIEAPLGSIAYFFVRRGTRFHKTVHFYQMVAIGGDLSAHDHEFDEVRWVSFDEAMALLSYETEREILARARQRISAGETAA
ncbi:MAG: NUDIX hydrolase [Candidatus Limnocylindria bacterium]